MWFLISLIAGCADPDETPVDSDTAPSSTDTDPTGEPPEGPECEGTLVLTFEDMPPSVLQRGERWSDQGVEFVVDLWKDSPNVVLANDQGSGCMMAQPGTVVGRLAQTGCAGQQARFTVSSLCPPTGAGCTEVSTGTYTSATPNATNSPTNMEEVTLSVSPVNGFSTFQFGSREGRLCRIEIDLIPMTPELEPPDTGTPF